MGLATLNRSMLKQQAQNRVVVSRRLLSLPVKLQGGISATLTVVAAFVSARRNNSHRDRAAIPFSRQFTDIDFSECLGRDFSGRPRLSQTCGILTLKIVDLF